MGQSIIKQAAPEAKEVPIWPHGKSYAVILNHDVDSNWGFEHEEGIWSLAAIEEAFGFRSAWLVVGKLFSKNWTFLEDLISRGHEIGCHGIEHSPFLAYSKKSVIIKTFDKMKSELRDLKCFGYRSPSYHHTPILFSSLSNFFSYDMSMHDTFEDVNRPVLKRSGCGTVFPFFIDGSELLEIPTTVPEDAILEAEGFDAIECSSLQLQSICSIRDRGGVVNLLTHPEPQFTSRPDWTSAYERVLLFISRDNSAWVCLPSELDQWWRARATRILASWNY